MITSWGVLALGLLLGVRHAFDADHLVAITTIVSEYRNPLRAIWIGVSWGLGHTTTMLIVGIFLLLMNLQLSERLAQSFELLVGLVLIFLGVQTFWGFRQRRIHIHPHHGAKPHLHFHAHTDTEGHDHPHPKLSLAQLLIAGIIPGEHRSAPANALKPFFRVKSYLVGIVHGLAGSAALMLLVLVNLNSTMTAVYYILLFGLGSVVSMGVISIFISLPFSLSARLPRLNLLVRVAAGTFSILFGLLLLYEVGIRDRLLVAS